MKTNIILALITFAVVFIFTYLNNLRKVNMILKKKKRKKAKEIIIIEMKYLNIKYNIDMNYMYRMSVIVSIALLNAFIISLVWFVIMMLPGAIIWKFLVGLALLMAMIYSFYGIYGKILMKICEKKGKK